MMEDFKFIGDWYFKMKLEKLAEIRNESFITRKDYQAEPDDPQVDLEEYSDLTNGLVWLNILEELNDPPEPGEEQLNAVGFIADNQEIIIREIFNLLRKIYPTEVYKNNLGLDAIPTYFRETINQYPKLETPDDLKAILGLTGVEILQEHKNGMAFYALNFNTCWDARIDGMFQYGFHVLMHEGAIVDWGFQGMYDEEVIEKETGLNYEEKNAALSDYANALDNFISPNKKYGKLRPSELDFNSGFPSRLIANNRTNRFMELVEENQIKPADKHIDWSYIIEDTIEKKDDPFFDFLVFQHRIFEKHDRFRWSSIIRIAARNKDKRMLNEIERQVLENGTKETKKSFKKLKGFWCDD